MKYKLLLLIIIICVFSYVSQSSDKFIGAASTYDGLKNITLEFDSTSCTLNFPFYELENIMTENCMLTEKVLTFYLFDDSNEIDISANSSGSFFMGGGRINGFSSGIKFYKVSEGLEPEIPLYPAKYVNMRDTADTFTIILSDSTDLKYLYKDEVLSIDLIEYDKVMLGDGSIMKVKYNKGRPYMMELTIDKKRQFFYRAQ